MFNGNANRKQQKAKVQPAACLSVATPHSNQRGNNHGLNGAETAPENVPKETRERDREFREEGAVHHATASTRCGSKIKPVVRTGNV
jgi:hypothetical protein